MQQLAIEQRRLLGARAPWHVGDVAWGLRQHAGREDEWRFRIWEDGGRVVAWSWLRADGKLAHDVHAEHRDLLDEVLDEPEATVAFALEDDDESRDALRRRGFSHAEDDVLHMLARDLADAPAPLPLPDGFAAKTVDDADLAERVAVHRDVWAPSRVTEGSFANVRATWPYRGSLDTVIEAPDGRFAAYCLIWPDDESRVGELEPVGVRKEFRRRGLGAAVCTDALRRLHAEGGREAIVYCVTAEACALYASLGFHEHARVVGYRR